MEHDDIELSRAIEESLSTSRNANGSNGSNGHGTDEANLMLFSEPVQLREPGVPTGLRNIGNTCYFNSFLPLYFSIPEFRKAVLEVHVDTQQAEVRGQIAALRDFDPAISTLRKRDFAFTFIKELQALFALLIVSREKAVNPTLLLNSFVNDSGQKVEVGPQQDVGEFAQLFLNRAEEGLGSGLSTPSGTPSRSENIVKRLFFGSITERSYARELDGTEVTNTSTAEFDSIILPIQDHHSLQDSLDAYTFVTDIEHFRTPRNHVTTAQKDAWFRVLPPVLSIQLKRVVFNAKTNSAEKLNSKFEFPAEFAMDRFLDEHRSAALAVRERVVIWRGQLQDAQKQLNTLTNFEGGVNSIEEHIRCTGRFIENAAKGGWPGGAVSEPREVDMLLRSLQTWLVEVHRTTAELRATIANLEMKIRGAFDATIPPRTMYRLHAVLVHRGQAMFGHYWAFIFDPTSQEWWKYNDSEVSRASFEEVERQSMGGDLTNNTSSAYCLVYVAANWFPHQQPKAAPDHMTPERLMEMVSPQLRERLIRERQTFEKKVAQERGLSSQAAASVDVAAQGDIGPSAMAWSASSAAAPPPSSPQVAQDENVPPSVMDQPVEMEIIPLTPSHHGAGAVPGSPTNGVKRSYEAPSLEDNQGGDTTHQHKSLRMTIDSAPPSAASTTTDSIISQHLRDQFAVKFQRALAMRTSEVRSNSPGSTFDVRIGDFTAYLFCSRAPDFIKRHVLSRAVLAECFLFEASISEASLSEASLSEHDYALLAAVGQEATYIVLDPAHASILTDWQRAYNEFLEVTTLWINGLDYQRQAQHNLALPYLFNAVVANAELKRLHFGAFPDSKVSAPFLISLRMLLVVPPPRTETVQLRSALLRAMAAFEAAQRLRSMMDDLDGLEELVTNQKQAWLSFLQDLDNQSVDDLSAPFLTQLLNDGVSECPDLERPIVSDDVENIGSRFRSMFDTQTF
ncbi:ubiquitin carboxyl-terminal hydrolase [Capsaspora owczarzaki ATCC 30864]|uniref:ubiquitinyl hydrolase 1 n=3 Tax=Capsaspora owczarzaki (strain ATCC 30864) TaxID=595528 RepID=A0A0D2WSJ7_CAPO3|nr:ubiquitin carboxyl-terminal hydrolase [Capsaspora owczarzaki ATCC 30864]